MSGSMRAAAVAAGALLVLGALPEDAGAAKAPGARRARLEAPRRTRGRPSGLVTLKQEREAQTLQLRARGLRRGEVHLLCCDDPATHRVAAEPFAEASADAAGRLSVRLDSLPHGADLASLAGAPFEVRTESGAVLLAGELPGPRATPAEGCTFIESVFVHETYDDATVGEAPAGWLVSGTDVAGVAVAIDDTVRDGDSGASVRLEDTVAADPGAPSMERAFNAQPGLFALEFTLIAGADPGRTVMQIGAGVAGGTEFATGLGEGLGFYEDGTIGFAVGDSIRPYSANASHRFRVEFDPATQTFDVLLDGELVVGGRALGGDATTLDRLRFGGAAATTGTAWLDRVTMLSIEEDCAPTANAGPDQTVECEGERTKVRLDGSASADTQGEALTFAWSGDFAGGTATGERPLVEFEGHGTFTVSLVVSDGTSTSPPDTVSIEIRDTSPPVIRVCGLPSKLSPVCDQMVRVEPVIMAVDACEGFDVELTLEILSSEPFDDEGDWTIHTPWDFELRATRRIYDCSRRYFLRWTATDSAGNSATAEASIPVGGSCCDDHDDDHDDDDHGHKDKGKGKWWWDHDD